MDAIEKQTISKVTWRLVPFLCFCYFIAYLDRQNVGFAKLQMNPALGLSDTMFGLGAGLFFISYFLLEVPSNLALDHFGAKRWIARIMFTWGLISAAFAYIEPIGHVLGLSNEHTFYLMRFLLGAAEAGFFPGVIFYITLWYPSVYRARIVGLFMLAIPVSSIIGAPLSGMLLDHPIAGLSGWQTMFLFEGIPALIVTFVVLFFLTDRPENATWLSQDERSWLMRRIGGENTKKQGIQNLTVLQAMTDPRIFAMAFMYFCLNAASYGVSYFLPTIVKGFSTPENPLSNFQIGMISALPFVFGAIGIIVLTRSSDRTKLRREHVCLAMTLAAVGILASTMVENPILRMAFLCVSQIGVSAMPPLFWPLPSAILTGVSAAAGIATINSLGNLSGFGGPYLMGYLKDMTGSFTAGLIVLGLTCAIGAVVTMMLKYDPASETPPAEPALSH